MNLQGVKSTPDLNTLKRDPLISEKLDDQQPSSFAGWVEKPERKGSNMSKTSSRPKDESGVAQSSRPIAKKLRDQDEEKVSEEKSEIPVARKQAVDPLDEKQSVNKAGVEKTKMLKFMDSLESEIGVTPEQWLQAMMTLSPEDLQQPPENTAQAVIANLDLDPNDQEKAMALYASLLISQPAARTGSVVPVVSVAAPPAFFVDNKMRSLTHNSGDQELLQSDFFPAVKSDKFLSPPGETDGFNTQGSLELSQQSDQLPLAPESAMGFNEQQKNVDSETSKAINDQNYAAKPSGENHHLAKANSGAFSAEALRSVKADNATSPQDFFKVGPQIFSTAIAKENFGQESEGEAGFEKGEESAMSELGGERSLVEPREISFAPLIGEVAETGEMKMWDFSDSLL